GGFAGHAGLFSTANDLARYARMLLSQGALDGARVLTKESVAQMTSPHDVPGGIRALGWDMQTRYSLNRGTTLSRRAFGHGGYTGTSMWIDPEEDLFVIFLSNRVHPDGKGSVNGLVGDIATWVGRAIGGAPPEAGAVAASHVVLGIDALAADQFAPLGGARVALLTNDAARAADGTRTVDVLASAKSVSLVALFSPEHGLGADRDQKIGDAVDTTSRLPVHSLYGDITAPTPEMLAGVDVIVADLPDAGARFYTYASTLHQTMRVAAKLGIRLVVLDRPNPIDAVDVAGPLLDPSERSFVNHHRLPIRHGMTIGELAEMINADEHLGLALEVVRMRNYRRAAYYDETGLTFRPPSPNLRTVEETLLYPAVALVEGTNVAVGRGTDTPFEVLGAPWIDGKRLAAALAANSLGGVSITATRFTPKSSNYAGEECGGIKIHIRDRARFEPIRTGVALALALRSLYREKWNASRLHEMIGQPSVTAAILDVRPLSQIEAMWKDDLEAFVGKRSKYLLYPL
ncbi:MAG TPA: exo-beta-N-acetylmuramidase NamZ domain-containing protein, partial [Polyangiaceae bacterium]